MKRRWNKATKLVVALAVAVVAATVVICRAREVEAGRADVARLTRTMKTVCIGRFLIDLPGETQFALRGPRINGFDISSFEESEANFKERLAKREAQLRATPNRLGGNKNLESVKEVRTHNGLSGKILFHSRTVSEGTQANGLKIERYRDEGIALEAMLHGQGVSFTLAANDYNPDIVENLPRLVAKLVPNLHNVIPTEPGFCIDRGWFQDPLKPDQREQIMMSAQLPSHPDFAFLTILAAGLKPDKQSLLERRASTGSLLSLLERWRIRELRAAPRTIGGITGDELVTRVAERNDTTGYSFWWEVDGTEDNVLVPHLVFQMSTGEGEHGPVSTSMTEDAAIALWDKISSSIRLRPSALPRPVTADLLTTPPGTGAAHGLCPASGWWRCQDPPALDTTRWFAQGRLPPSASLPVPPGVFGRAPDA